MDSGARIDMLSQGKERRIRALRQTKARRRSGLVLVEGTRAVSEALSSPVSIRYAVVDPTLAEHRQGAEILRALRSRGIGIVEVDADRLRSLSDTETPQGVLLIVDEPIFALSSISESGSGLLRVLALDGVQDPGNVGTLVRTARAFGVDAVVALTGTADLWSAKAVRSAAGATFHLPSMHCTSEVFRQWTSERELPILVADAGGAPISARGRSHPWALVMGREASGPGKTMRTAAEEVVAIPMPGGGESLNVAISAGILLYALTNGSA